MANKNNNNAATATSVSNVTGEEVQVLIWKLQRAKNSLLSQLPLVDLSDATTTSTQQQHQKGGAPPKHWKQTESICGHLKHLGIIPSNKSAGCCVIELGCGTGKLSDHVSETMEGDCSHILIDIKAASSFKAERLRDGSIRKRQKPTRHFTRVTADLQDKELIQRVVLEEDTKQEDATTSSTNFIAISKHLCGSAADYAIQGLDYYATNTSRTKGCQFPLPLAVATCCHHRCQASSFSNMDFFTHLGFSSRDFEVLRTVSQWSSIKVQQRKTADKDKTKADREVQYQYATLPSLPSEPIPIVDLDGISSPLVPSEQFEREFTREEKAALGKQCKLALDTARGHALKRMGYSDIRFVRYTTLSLEDTLLIAT